MKNQNTRKQSIQRAKQNIVYQHSLSQAVHFFTHNAQHTAPLKSFKPYLTVLNYFPISLKENSHCNITINNKLTDKINLTIPSKPLPQKN